jgi:putative transposase
VTFKAYRYRFYRTTEQAKNLARTFGCVRYFYNWSLRYRQSAFYQRQEEVSDVQNSALLAQLKKQDEWRDCCTGIPSL